MEGMRERKALLLSADREREIPKFVET